jgi:hypothetical protein
MMIMHLRDGFKEFGFTNASKVVSAFDFYHGITSYRVEVIKEISGDHCSARVYREIQLDGNAGRHMERMTDFPDIFTRTEKAALFDALHFLHDRLNRKE